MWTEVDFFTPEPLAVLRPSNFVPQQRVCSCNRTDCCAALMDCSGILRVGTEQETFLFGSTFFSKVRSASFL